MARVYGLVSKLGWLGIGMAAVGTAVSQCLFNVDGGERAIIFDKFRGVLPYISGEGTHFMIPLIQKPYMYSIRSTPRSVRVETGSKDLQSIDITLRVLFHPQETQLVNIFRNLGVEYADKVLPSITTGTLLENFKYNNSVEPRLYVHKGSSKCVNRVRINELIRIIYINNSY